MRTHHDHFVADGCQRARAANYETIRMQVEQAYAERLAAAAFCKRWQLRREMQRDLERLLDRVAPPWGLYFTS
jgi:hypothetical protein